MTYEEQKTLVSNTLVNFAQHIKRRDVNAFLAQLDAMPTGAKIDLAVALQQTNTRAGLNRLLEIENQYASMAAPVAE